MEADFSAFGYQFADSMISTGSVIEAKGENLPAVKKDLRFPDGLSFM